VAGLVERADRHIHTHQKAVDRATAMIGRPSFVIVVTAFILGWVGVNIWAGELHLHAIDPAPFPRLQALISLGALYTTLVVIATQNRQGKVLEQRDHLELQAILLTEQKVTKIIALLEELRRDLPNVFDRDDSEAEALQEGLNADAVLTALENSLDWAAENVAA
jgi:uncharacterized membrane protein